jgi:D-inositol-3-phosphate glycosyltransferase
LKVAIVESVGGHGGMDYYDFGLCEGLSKTGTQVTLYTCDETRHGGVTSCEMRLPYRRIYGDDSAWLRGVRYLRGSIQALLSAKLGRARIAHFHFFHVGPLELFNVLLAKLLGLRVVVTAHDVQSFIERLSVPWMLKMAYRISDKVIAQSKVSEGELRKVLQIPEAKITVIPHGNYLPFIGKVPAREEARAWVGLSNQARVLLFFGHIKRVKGLDILLAAMPRLVQEHPNIMLLVAGKVWKDDLQRYQRQVEVQGVSSHCTFHTRFIPDSEVAYYYAAADVIVLPYRRIYQSGVLLMAMSYGKPVVVSDIEGMTEVVTDGENGYVFPAGDAEALADKLIEATSNPEKSRRVGTRALSHMQEHHDWNTIGQMTAAAYRSVMKEW